MNDEPTPRLRRATRYSKLQARKDAQRRADQKFYGAMFAMMGVLALLAVLLGAIAMNGVPDMGEPGAMREWAEPWIFGWTRLEIAGVGFVLAIAGIIALRLRKKR